MQSHSPVTPTRTCPSSTNTFKASIGLYRCPPMYNCAGPGVPRCSWKWRQEEGASAEATQRLWHKQEGAVFSRGSHKSRTPQRGHHSKRIRVFPAYTWSFKFISDIYICLRSLSCNSAQLAAQSHIMRKWNVARQDKQDLCAKLGLAEKMWLFLMEAVHFHWPRTCTDNLRWGWR